MLKKSNSSEARKKEGYLNCYKIANDNALSQEKRLLGILLLNLLDDSQRVENFTFALKDLETQPDEEEEKDLRELCSDVKVKSSDMYGLYLQQINRAERCIRDGVPSSDRSTPKSVADAVKRFTQSRKEARDALESAKKDRETRTKKA